MNYLSKVPGFRTGKEINEILASIYYLFVSFSICISFGNLSQVLTEFSWFIIPYIITGSIDVAKYQGKNRYKHFFRKIIFPFIIIIAISILSILAFNTNN